MPTEAPVRQPAALALSVASLGAVAALDAVTGQEVTLSPFYLLPLGLAAWFGGHAAGILMAIACASSAFIVDHLLQDNVYQDASAPYWNLLSRFLLYLLVAVILIRFRHAAQELKSSNASLSTTLENSKRLVREITVLSEMGSILHSSDSLDEAGAAIATFGPQVFPTLSGTVYISAAAGHYLMPAASWGARREEGSFAPTDCWSIRLGTPYRRDEGQTRMPCRHVAVAPGEPVSYLCIPLSAQGETLGLLHLRPLEPHADPLSDGSTVQIARTVAEALGLAVANIKLRQTLREQSVKDPLTGLFNRRFLDECSRIELSRADRLKSKLAVVALDLDHFKRFNDSFGHETGDLVLKAMGALLKTHARQSDIPCRLGGEEFLVVLPDTGSEGAATFAERVLEAVRRIALKGVSEVITASAGLACYPDDGSDFQAVLGAADSALYRAKHEGRNRVAAYARQV